MRERDTQKERERVREREREGEREEREANYLGNPAFSMSRIDRALYFFTWVSVILTWWNFMISLKTNSVHG